MGRLRRAAEVFNDPRTRDDPAITLRTVWRIERHLDAADWRFVIEIKQSRCAITPEVQERLLEILERTLRAKLRRFP
jgi:hypothetical protein